MHMVASMWLFTMTRKDLWWRGVGGGVGGSKRRARREATRDSEKHSQGVEAWGNPGRPQTLAFLSGPSLCQKGRL